MRDHDKLGTPFAIASIIHLAPGELDKQETLYTISDDRLLIVETVGINAFLQPGQELMPSIMPVYDGGLTVYPLALTGTAAATVNAEMPFRRFGSQTVRLYANDRIDISAVRSSNEGKGYIEFNVSGRLLDPDSRPRAPGNLRVD